MKYLYLDVKPHGVFGRIKKHVLIAKHIWIFLEQWSCTILQTWIFFGYIDMTQNFKDKGKLSRIITHMQKVGHTSEFPFGIYWWTLKNLKNQNFEKKWKKKKENAGDITLHMCTKNCNHMRYSSWDMNETHFFCHFRPFFALLPHYWPWKLKFGKKCKSTCRYPFTHVLHKSRSYDVWFLRYKEQRTKFFVILPFFALWPS